MRLRGGHEVGMPVELVLGDEVDFPGGPDSVDVWVVGDIGVIWLLPPEHKKLCDGGWSSSPTGGMSCP